MLRMVERHIGDDADAEVQDVGGGETPTEPDLTDEEIDAGPREVVEGCTGQDLELGWRTELGGNLIDDGLDFGQERGEVCLGDGMLVDLDAFRVRDEVWLRHQPNPVVRRLEDARQHGADRAFAIGAPDVHALEEVLRIAKRMEQSQRPLEAELDPEAAERG